MEVGCAREWDSTAQIIWWICAFAHFRGNTACMSLILLLRVGDVVETVTFETETWLKLQDRDFIKNSETETRDLKFDTETRVFEIYGFCRKFWKNVVFTSKLYFLNFLAFFQLVLVVSYQKIQQTKNRWIVEILLNNFFAIFKVSRLVAFETESRPENFETETRKNGSRDESRDRDQVSRLHHCSE